VQSVVLYGSETWTMRKVDSDRIQSFHMQALRRRGTVPNMGTRLIWAPCETEVSAAVW